TAELPFQAETVSMLQYLNLHAPRPHPSALSSVPREVDEVIACAMARKVEQRHPSAGALREAFARAAGLTSPPLAAEARTLEMSMEVRPREIAPESPSAELVDRLHEVVSAAVRALGPYGFETVVRSGNSAIVVGTLGGDEPARRRDAIEAAKRIAIAL